MNFHDGWDNLLSPIVQPVASPAAPASGATRPQACFAALAGVAGVLAASLIRDGMQAHRHSLAWTSSHPPQCRPRSRPGRPYRRPCRVSGFLVQSPGKPVLEPPPILRRLLSSLTRLSPPRPRLSLSARLLARRVACMRRPVYTAGRSVSATSRVAIAVEFVAIVAASRALRCRCAQASGRRDPTLLVLLFDVSSRGWRDRVRLCGRRALGARLGG
jgi:hypothetical protein